MRVPPVPQEPLFFHRLLKEKVWGGKRLATMLEASLDFDGPLGETWELSDYPGEETTVRGGPCDGFSLRELMEHHGSALLGESKPSRDGRFPLLVKFIDAGDDLSVQIHPPDGPKSPTGVGKTEAWYVLDAEPGAGVICGLSPDTNRQTFEQEAGDSRVQNHLYTVPVSAGDCIFVPSGMTHAIRTGVILCEVQQTSDVTYRMYDWDRMGLDGKPRETHLSRALDVVDYELGPGRAIRAEFENPGESANVISLAECKYFTLQAVRVNSLVRHEPHGLARVLSVVKGSGSVRTPGSDQEPRTLRFGDVILLPGTLDAIEVHPDEEGLEFLEGIAR